MASEFLNEYIFKGEYNKYWIYFYNKIIETLLLFFF